MESDNLTPERAGGEGWAIRTDLLVSLSQSSFIKRFTHVFPSLWQKPTSLPIIHHDDFPRRWLDDGDPGTEYELGGVEETVWDRWCGFIGKLVNFWLLREDDHGGVVFCDNCTIRCARKTDPLPPTTLLMI